MTVADSTSERYVDEFGGAWELRAVLTPGGRRLILTDPDGLGHELTPVRPKSPRPSVDAETPLPLDI